MRDFAKKKNWTPQCWVYSFIDGDDVVNERIVFFETEQKKLEDDNHSFDMSAVQSSM